MAQIDLLFSQLPVTGQPVEIVFGADEGTPTVATNAYLSGTLPQPGLQGTITIGPVVDAAIAATLPPPGLDALLDMRQVYAVHLSGALPQPVLLADLPAEYLTNTSRPTVGQALAPWTPSSPLQTGTQDQNQDTQAHPAGAAPRWQHATPAPAQSTAPITNALRTPVAHSTGFAKGVALATRAVALHQDAQRAVRNLVRDAFANAARAQTQPLTQRHQDGLRDRRAWRNTGWQVAQPTPPKSYTSGQGPAQWLNKGFGADHQNAMRPPPGIYVPPPIPGADPCYLPTLPAHLLFDAPWTGDAHLVFVCERHGPGPDPEPGETIVVPIRRVYVVINEARLRRVDGDIQIPTFTMSMSLDADSWAWGFSADVPRGVLPNLQPSNFGDPVELEAWVNGVPYRFLAEQLSTSRTFGKESLRISGRGLTATLDAPYAPTLNFGNTAARTAQQLMGDVLTVNGVPFGWTVDWQLTDWLVPGNVWTHQGAYVGALNSIVQAAGGYLQPHESDKVVKALLRYPTAPWDWGAAADFELPADVTTQEGIVWQENPRYNRVFVSGVAAGVLGQVTRAGTDGASIAPMVTDALITHADAARQRGVRELATGGRQATVSLQLPVLETTGVIPPGKMVRYVDGSTTRVGITRSVQVDVRMPEIFQSIEVETYA